MLESVTKGSRGEFDGGLAATSCGICVLAPTQLVRHFTRTADETVNVIIVRFQGRG